VKNSKIIQFCVIAFIGELDTWDNRYALKSYHIEGKFVYRRVKADEVGVRGHKKGIAIIQADTEEEAAKILHSGATLCFPDGKLMPPDAKFIVIPVKVWREPTHN